MNKKWSSGKVKEVQRLLIKRWPESFTQGPDLRPLSLEIDKELLLHRDEYPQLSSRVVSEVLKRHTTSFGYLYGMAKNEFRYNLQGEPVERVSAEHREWARQQLRVKQKIAQKVRKDARRKVFEESKSSSQVTVKSRPSERASTRASPVIKYKPSRRRISKPTAENAVDMAS